MFIQSKLVPVFAGILVISLSACQTLEDRQATIPVPTSSPTVSPTPLPKATIPSPAASPTPLPKASPIPSPAASPTPAKPKPRTRQANQNAPTPTNFNAERAKYKAIALDTVTVPRQGTDPKAIALTAFGNLDSEGGTKNIQVETPTSDRTVIIITQTGIADDSVGAIKHRVEFATDSATSQQWKMVWAGSQVKCNLGRGHQDYSTQLCQ